MRFKIINRQADAARRQHSVEQFKKQGIDIEVFNNIDHRYLLQNSLTAHLFRKADYWDHDCNQEGVMSCNLGHMMLWLECFATNEPYAIFEDDLWAFDPIDFDWNELVKQDFDIHIISKAFRCDQYIIKPEAARRLFDWFLINGWERTLDFHLQDFKEDPSLGFKVTQGETLYFSQDILRIPSQLQNIGREPLNKRPWE